MKRLPIIRHVRWAYLRLCYESWFRAGRKLRKVPWIEYVRESRTYPWGFERHVNDFYRIVPPDGAEMRKERLARIWEGRE